MVNLGFKGSLSIAGKVSDISCSLFQPEQSPGFLNHVFQLPGWEWGLMFSPELLGWEVVWGSCSVGVGGELSIPIVKILNIHT